MRSPVLIFLIDSCACRDMISEVSWWSSLEAFYMAVNPDKLNEFLGKAIVDFGATFHAALIRIGDKLGLYKALGQGAHRRRASLQRRPEPPSDTFENGCAAMRREDTSLTILAPGSSI